MTLDLPTITLPAFDPYIIAIAAIITGVLLATSKQPKYLFFVVPILFASCVWFVSSIITLFGTNQNVTITLVVSSVVIAFIWRENKPDPNKK